jgi:hypothetical protein
MNKLLFRLQVSALAALMIFVPSAYPAVPMADDTASLEQPVTDSLDTNSGEELPPAVDSFTLPDEFGFNADALALNDRPADEEPADSNETDVSLNDAQVVSELPSEVIETDETDTGINEDEPATGENSSDAMSVDYEEEAAEESAPEASTPVDTSYQYYKFVEDGKTMGMGFVPGNPENIDLIEADVRILIANVTGDFNVTQTVMTVPGAGLQFGVYVTGPPAGLDALFAAIQERDGIRQQIAQEQADQPNRLETYGGYIQIRDGRHDAFIDYETLELRLQNDDHFGDALDALGNAFDWSDLYDHIDYTVAAGYSQFRAGDSDETWNQQLQTSTGINIAMTFPVDSENNSEYFEALPIDIQIDILTGEYEASLVVNVTLRYDDTQPFNARIGSYNAFFLVQGNGISSESQIQFPEN